jgi:hypothetical protein
MDSTKMWKRLVSAVAFAFLMASAVSGQTVTGRILGTVLDPTGAGIPTAEVTISNQETGISLTLRTDTVGNYIAPSLAPGLYSVKVAANGFRTSIANGNTVSVAQTTRVDVTLQVGTLAESVEVTAVAPLVQSTTSDLGETIEKRQVQILPLNGRIFAQLAQLVPGAVPLGHGDATESASGAGARTAITASVNGVPWSGTSYTIDGVSNSEPMNAFINIAPPIEAIEEFKVQTSNPSAEFGTYGGAVVNLTLRSGTNNVHGSLFEYLRNDDLNARSFFAVQKAPWKTNQFGGTLGGPIIRNKAFFFGDYQGLRLRSGRTYNLGVPTAAMLDGRLLSSEGFATIYDPDSSATAAGVIPFPNNEVPKLRWDPISTKVLSIYPRANSAPSTPGPYQNFRLNASDSQRMDAFDIKGDYQFEKLGRLFLRESYVNRDLDVVPPGNQFMSADPDSESRNHNAVLGYSASIRPTLLNELRLAFNRFNTFHFGQDYGVDKSNELGIKNGNLAAFPESSGISNFSVSPLVGFGAPAWTNGYRQATMLELTNGTTWVKGAHTIKFGTDLRRLRATLTNPEQNARGAFTFGRDMTSSSGKNGAEFATFLLGYPSTIARGLVNTRPDVRVLSGGLYVQNDWRVNRSLTVNAGLRWDIFTAPVDNYNRQTNFNLSTGKFDRAKPGNRVPNVDTKLTNFAPRLGFAWTPNQGQTAFRSAFGVSYFNQNYGGTAGFLERNFPLFQSFSTTASTSYRPFSKLSVDGLPNFAPTPLTDQIDPIKGIQPLSMPRDFSPVMILMWNAGVQQRLGDDGVGEVAYVGTRGTHLYRRRPINTPLTPAAGALDPRRPYYSISPLTQSISLVDTGANSDYHGLQLKYSRRLADGLQGLLAYTYAESMDDMSIFWVWDDRMNWRPSTNQMLDLRHVFSGSWTYTIPVGKARRFLADAPKAVDLVAGGWSVNGIAVLRTGSPMSVAPKNNLLNTGTSNVANVTCSDIKYPKTVERWFDTSCFADPTEPYVFGNAFTGTLRGPGVVNFDLSVFKGFAMPRETSMEFRAEFFNASTTLTSAIPTPVCRQATSAGSPGQHSLRERSSLG